MLLRARGPFHLSHTLESGQVFRWRREGEWHCGVVAGNLFKVRQVASGMEFFSTPEPEEATASMLSSYFRLEDDLSAVYRTIGRDPRVLGAIRRYRGLRLLRQDPWECLASFIISVYSNIPRIRGHIEQLSQAFGQPIALEGHTRYTFPLPERLAEVPEHTLRAMGLGFRARSLVRLVQGLRETGADLLELRSRPYGEAQRALLRLHGVGEKVADCVLLFSLDKLEAFPLDVWVRRALLEWYFSGQRVTDRALRLWAIDYFGPYAGYAQQYLYHHRRLQGLAPRHRWKKDGS